MSEWNELFLDKSERRERQRKRSDDIKMDAWNVLCSLKLKEDKELEKICLLKYDRGFRSLVSVSLNTLNSLLLLGGPGTELVEKIMRIPFPYHGDPMKKIIKAAFLRHCWWETKMDLGLLGKANGEWRLNYLIRDAPEGFTSKSYSGTEADLLEVAVFLFPKKIKRLLMFYGISLEEIDAKPRAWKEWFRYDRNREDVCFIPYQIPR